MWQPREGREGFEERLRGGSKRRETATEQLDTRHDNVFDGRVSWLRCYGLLRGPGSVFVVMEKKTRAGRKSVNWR